MRFSLSSTRHHTKLLVYVLLGVVLLGVTKAGLSAPRSLADSPGRIVFSSGRDGNEEIYVMNPDGTGQARLTRNIGRDSSPKLSSDGRKIVWEAEREDDLCGIYIMNADGSHQKRIGSGYSPAFSPDGNRIVYATTSRNIALMNVDGSNIQSLTQSKTNDAQPSFSPDGKRIVFVSYRDFVGKHQSVNEVYVMDADGGHLERLTSALDEFPAKRAALTQENIAAAKEVGKYKTTFAVSKSNPVFSPDGCTIAFATNIPHSVYSLDDWFISVMNRDGSNTRQITSGEWACSAPSFSPDGKHLVLEAARLTLTEDPLAGVYTMYLNGGEFTRIVSDEPVMGRFVSWGGGKPTVGAAMK